MYVSTMNIKNSAMHNVWRFKQKHCVSFGLWKQATLCKSACSVLSPQKYADASSKVFGKGNKKEVRYK